MEIKFIKPTLDHVRYIAENMREADRVEIKASHNHTPIESLTWGMENSDYSVVVTVNDVPCVMLGLVVRDILTNTGTPWLLGAESVMRHRSQLLKCSPPVIDEMLRICPTLYNHVHLENKTSIRWLKWLGFTVDEPEPIGINGEYFCKFHKER